MAEVPSLIEAFERGEDIHARTAADIFGMPLEAVDKEARRRAKTLNFGIIYGMSAFGLGGRLGIPPGEAKAIIDAYFSRYPASSPPWSGSRRRRARRIRALPFGRKLWIRNIAAKEVALRAGAERQAINAPFQGGAAEIIKRAMVRVAPALREAGLAARMLLQVHDELVLEAPEAGGRRHRGGAEAGDGRRRHAARAAAGRGRARAKLVGGALAPTKLLRGFVGARGVLSSRSGVASQGEASPRFGGGCGASATGREQDPLAGRGATAPHGEAACRL
jgi:hypothetical protein